MVYAGIENRTTAVRGIGESSGNAREIPERLLWKLWKRRAARQAEFRTGSGTRIRVVYPGRTGTSAGPDFRDALLDVEGLGLVRGDVEIHRRQRDWDAHGHADDPNYNGVVIHGALETGDPETALQSGTVAPVVSLSELVAGTDGAEPAASEIADDLWQLLAAQGYTKPDTPEEAGALLDQAGDARFRRKAATLGRFATEQGPDQTMYEALMEGLGYRHNQQPFVRLAQAAPIAALRRAAAPVLAEQRPMVLRHWLLTVSGLSGGGAADARNLPSGLGPVLEERDWRLFRVRPSNHPRVRISGAAELLARFMEQGLLTGLAGQAGSPSGLVAALTVPGCDGAAAPIGVGRARDLAANVVLPLLHWLDGKPESTYRELYRRFPKLQDNEVGREMAEQLLPPDWRGMVNSARRQQGLLHLASLLRGAG